MISPPPLPEEPAPPPWGDDDAEKMAPASADGTRRWFLFLAGFFLFVIGVIYLRTAAPSSGRSGFATYGTGTASSGETTVRVTAFQGKERTASPPSVVGVSVGGKPVPYVATRDGDAAHVTLKAPPPGSTIQLALEGTPGRRTAEWTTHQTDHDPAWEPAEKPDATPCEGNHAEFFAWILPSGGVWVAGVSNRALVRVATTNSDPMVGAKVRMKDADGEMLGEVDTDSAGVAMIRVDLGPSAKTVRIEVASPGQATYHVCPSALVPVYAKTRLLPPGILRTDTAAVAVQVLTYAKSDRVYCELLERGALVWGHAGVSKNGVLEVVLPAGTAPRRATLQCSNHPAIPGAGGGGALVVDGVDAPRRWRALLLSLGVADESAGGLFPESAPLTPLAIEWMGSLVRPSLAPLDLLSNTATADRQRELAELAETRRYMLWLFGAGAAAMALWMASEVRRNYRAMRRSYAHYVEEVGPEAATMPDGTFARRRSKGHFVAIAIIVLLNAIGIVLLLDLIL